MSTCDICQAPARYAARYPAQPGAEDDLMCATCADRYLDGVSHWETAELDIVSIPDEGGSL